MSDLVSHWASIMTGSPYSSTLWRIRPLSCGSYSTGCISCAPRELLSSNWLLDLKLSTLVRHLHHFITDGVEQILVRLLPALWFSIPIPEVAIVCESNSALSCWICIFRCQKGLFFYTFNLRWTRLEKSLDFESCFFTLFDELCFMIWNAQTGWIYLMI